jgi:glycosyltransferase involved in cell wall biosynthesis
MPNNRIKFNINEIKNIINAYSEDDIYNRMLSSDTNEKITFYTDLAVHAFEKNNIRIAEIAIQRACFLSEYDESLLPIVEKILIISQNSSLLREIYKRIGIRYTNKGDIWNACIFFDKWQYTDASIFHIDDYHYDLDILNAVKVAAGLKSFSPSMPVTNQKIKIGYLVNHAIHAWSALMRTALFFAQHHNKDIFEVYIIISEPIENIKNSVAAQAFIQQFKEYNCKIIYPEVNYANLIAHTAQMIFQLKLHLLISLAALSNFAHYAILSLRPAPLIAGILGGPCPQYVPMNIDFIFSWLKHPFMESPKKSYYILMDDKPKVANSQKTMTKAELGIPPDSCLLVMAGRFVKFQNKQYWEEILNVLLRHVSTQLLVLGVKLDEIKFLKSLLQANNLTDRVHFSHWQPDYIPTLACADVFIDTYPAGGGGTILDAAGLEIPVVSFDSDYTKTHSQMNWRLADELFGIDYEGILPIENFEAFQNLLDKLIIDSNYRKKLGKIACERVYERHSYTKEGIKKLEDIFIKEIKAYKANTTQKNINQDLIDLLSNNGTIKNLFDILKNVLTNKLKKKITEP